MARGFFGNRAAHARAGAMSRGNTTRGRDRRGGRRSSQASE